MFSFHAYNLSPVVFKDVDPTATRKPFFQSPGCTRSPPPVGCINSIYLNNQSPEPRDRDPPFLFAGSAVLPGTVSADGKAQHGWQARPFFRRGGLSARGSLPPSPVNKVVRFTSTFPTTPRLKKKKPETNNKTIRERPLPRARVHDHPHPPAPSSRWLARWGHHQFHAPASPPLRAPSPVPARRPG